MNLLFLGGAKRVSMARKFKEAGRRLGLSVSIYSYELSTSQPIAAEAERVIAGRRWTDPLLDSELRDIIARHDIAAVIPFVDGAVVPATRLADAAFVPASSGELCGLMFDKKAADTRFRALGLPLPDAYNAANARPYIAKPRFGSASRGLVTFDSATLPAGLDPGEYLIQERIDRRREITVDCYIEPSSGRICALVPRERLEVTGGEVSRTRTLHSGRIDALARAIIDATGLRGAVTIQLIEDLADGRLMIMEINPRLGGGAVCAVGAGADIPAMILHNAAGMQAAAAAGYRDIEMARYMDEVFFPVCRQD